MTTRPLLLTTVLILISLASRQGALIAAEAPDRPRIIATTDGEIDDRCSMVRFLQYANEWEIEGIVYSSSKFHWKGHNWAGTDWIERDIDLYATFFDNLKQHAPGFPSPQELKNVVYVGNIDNVGEMEKETPGSNHIVKVLLDSRPGPVYLQAWGGTNTIARALKTIQEKHPDQMKRVSQKAIIYIILDQDDTFTKYILPNWPDLQVLGSFRQFGCIAYRWNQNIPSGLHEYFQGPWMKENILAGHGPLCARYEAHGRGSRKGFGEGDFRSEGDSPAFMHQIDVGLRSLEHPSYGGWGGRFTRDKRGKSVWRGAEDDGDLNKPIWRFAEAFQNDWAARADWCVKPREKANHPPIVNLDHALNLKAESGDTVKLSAKGTEDPDGDQLTYRWWQYKEPGSYRGTLEIRGADRPEASFVVPSDARRGQTAHLVCEVTDTGNPPLTRYRRVIVTFQ
jgi:hypothetical protein